MSEKYCKGCGRREVALSAYTFEHQGSPVSVLMCGACIERELALKSGREKNPVAESDRTRKTEREERLREREHWLIQQIQSVQEKCIAEALPFSRELADIRDSRRPAPIEVNGHWVQYMGPLPEYKLPEER